jgi:hypothetical protein
MAPGKITATEQKHTLSGISDSVCQAAPDKERMRDEENVPKNVFKSYIYSAFPNVEQ